jgi:predicted nucleic acid-binding protein
MRGFLLDTNIPSELMRPRPDPNVTAWIESALNESLFVSVISIGELRRGVALLDEESARRTELENLINEIVPSWFEAGS